MYWDLPAAIVKAVSLFFLHVYYLYVLFVSKHVVYLLGWTIIVVIWFVVHWVI